MHICNAGEFGSFLRYTRSLRFAESPNYTYLMNLFSGLMQQRGWPCDWDFDWLNVSLVSLTGCRSFLHDVLSTFYQFLGRVALVGQRPIVIKLSRGRSVGLCVGLYVHRCIVEKRPIGSGCRLAS